MDCLPADTVGTRFCACALSLGKLSLCKLSRGVMLTGVLLTSACTPAPDAAPTCSELMECVYGGAGQRTIADAPVSGGDALINGYIENEGTLRAAYDADGSCANTDVKLRDTCALRCGCALRELCAHEAFKLALSERAKSAEAADHVTDPDRCCDLQLDVDDSVCRGAADAQP